MPAGTTGDLAADARKPPERVNGEQEVPACGQSLTV